MEHNHFITLAVNRFPGHRGWAKKKILDLCRDEKDLHHIAELYLSKQKPALQKHGINVERILRDVEKEIKQLQHWDIGYSVLGNSNYPENLAMINDPPLVLYQRGNFRPRNANPIAIVGTRRPKASAQREAYKIALEFALAGYPVVSGMAFGIDRSAHEGALDGSGSTWAVLAGGLDKPSPFSHRRLASRILNNGGALLGEIPPGGFPAKYAFPRRNRILSGLCPACIVVQAPARSGALITADFALDQNRDLYVGSSGISGRNSAGTQALENQGAPVVAGAVKVLADWGKFLDMRSVESLPSPQNSRDLVKMLKLELNGRIYRHVGAYFEYHGA